MDAANDTLNWGISAITEQVEQHKHVCTIIHGEIGAGKTRYAERLLAALKKRGLTVGGIISPRLLSGEETIGYRVRDTTTGKERLLATVNPPGVRIGKFYLSRDALDFARKAIESAAAVAQVVFLDEVGRLELAGQGHAPALRALLRSTAIPILFVRSEFVQRVIESFSIPEHVELPVDQLHVVR